MPNEDQIRILIREELARMSGSFFSDKYIISRHTEFQDGRDIILSQGVGTRIGTSASQKLGFFGTTPADQPAQIGNPSGGVTQDAEARSAISSINSAIQELGITAS